MKKLFIDTSGWLAILNKRDADHQTAAAIYYERFEDNWTFYTHVGIMLEVGNSLSQPHARALAVALKELVDTSPRFYLAELDRNLYHAGWELLPHGAIKNGAW